MSNYLLDKGYTDYERFEQFIQNDIAFVIRLKHNASHQQVYENPLSESTYLAVLLDEQISLPIRRNGQIERHIQLRCIVYWDEKYKICYQSITNIPSLKPEQIAAIYKCRWANRATE